MKRYAFELDVYTEFTDLIYNHNYILKCLPRELEYQRLYDEKLIVEPENNFNLSYDSFKNKIIYGSINDVHEYFHYNVSGKIWMNNYIIRDGVDEVFLYDTSSTKLSIDMIDKINSLNLDVSSQNIDEIVDKISNFIFNYIEYTPNFTTIDTKAKEAFEYKKGVCQDMSHIMIGFLHFFKIPARYCAGIMVGEGKTHAWVEYYNGVLWKAVDPTNNRFVNEGYIKFSHGRDSRSCEVERGLFSVVNNFVDQRVEINAKVVEIHE